MFDENFSFLTSTSGPCSCGSDDTSPSSPELSPFSSRCSSPVPPAAQPFQTSLAFRQRDSRFDSRPSRPKISTARDCLIEPPAAALSQPLYDSSTDVSSASSLCSGASTPNTDPGDFDLNGSFPELDYDQFGPSDHAENITYPPCHWDFEIPDFQNPTSHPADVCAPSFALRRRQRQSLARLQCMVKKAPDLAILAEECHPSSLPLLLPVVEGGTGRLKTTGNRCAGGRIEKERRSSVVAMARGLSGSSATPRTKRKPR